MCSRRQEQVGTPELRTARLTYQISIEVDGQEAKETESKKIEVNKLGLSCAKLRSSWGSLKLPIFC